MREGGRRSTSILDHIGAPYLPRDLEALDRRRPRRHHRLDGRRDDGGDRRARRSSASASRSSARRSARGRSQEKAAIVAAFIERFGADLRDGRIRPVIDRVYELHEVEEAHRRVAGDHFGKIVLAREPLAPD